MPPKVATPIYSRFDSHVSEDSALMEPLTFSPNKEYLLFEKKISIGTESEYLDDSATSTNGLWDSTKSLLIMPTLNLIVAMCSLAIFPLLFSTLGPMFIGILLANKQDVALFGVFVGMGEISGSLFAGRLISRLGIRISALLAGGLTVVCLGLSALVFPLTGTDSAFLAPRLVLFLFLGLCIGMGDASSGVLISTIIGKIYSSNSQAAFALYTLVFNLSSIPLYAISSFVYFYDVLIIMLIFVSGNVVAIYLIELDYFNDR